jgi:hypothetical protein
MSGLLTAPAPVSGPSSRSDGPAPLAASPRPVAAARDETARAPKPVDAAARGLDIRFEDRQGRPVGPPPAFQVSLLQAMQEATLSPRPNAPSAFAEEGEAFAAPEQVDRKV